MMRHGNREIFSHHREFRVEKIFPEIHPPSASGESGGQKDPGFCQALHKAVVQQEKAEELIRKIYGYTRYTDWMLFRK